MGKIKIIKKYDLNTSAWRDALTLDEQKKAFAIASYKEIKHKDEDSYNYIIVADGCKVEDRAISPDCTHIQNSSFGISNIMNYFNKKDDNYRIRLIMVDIDGPHVDESIWLAKYINKLSLREDVKTINYLGFSKCGVMGLNLIKYLNKEALLKTRVYSISSPYTGSILASPIYLKQECKKILSSILGENIITDKIVEELLKVHFNIFTDSHMDYDISLPGGISKDAMNRYDPRFLENIFSEENISAAHRVAHWQNICTHITDKTKREIIRSGNLMNIGFCIINKYLYNKMSDGIVPLKSQKTVERYFDDEHRTSKVIAAPHSIMFTSSYVNPLLDIVDGNMSDEILSLKRKNKNDSNKC